MYAGLAPDDRARLHRDAAGGDEMALATLTHLANGAGLARSRVFALAAERGFSDYTIRPGEVVSGRAGWELFCASGPAEDVALVWAQLESGAEKARG